MTSKEALKLAIRCSFFAQDNDELQETYEAREKLEKDLDRLEKLEKENQELKQKVNYFEKVIEAMKNPSKLDCTHMFDNCKKLTPLPESPELKENSQEIKEKER